MVLSGSDGLEVQQIGTGTTENGRKAAVLCLQKGFKW